MIPNTETRDAFLEAHRPALVKLTDNLVAAAFPLMKIYPAYFCLERAIMQGIVSNDSLVVESSSGTMGLGLAMACRWNGLKLTIISDYSCDHLVEMRLRDLGANVEIVSAPSPVGGYQRARLDKLAEIRAVVNNSWWLNQYDNLGNGEAYSRFAAQIVECIGKLDCLVGTVGSGGSMCGTAKYLRMLFPEMTVVGVDTFRSVLFGQPDGPRPLRGLGNSLLPKNLDHSMFDEVHWVSAAEAFAATRILHRETGLFRGATSGACWMVAKHWAEENPRARTMCIFPDDGYRYVATVYNDGYLRDNNLGLEHLPVAPRMVSRPVEAHSHWCKMLWSRQTLEQVVGAAGSGNGYA
jgi:S-sulfo-L-cysteine synthase (3-phospho-L-serine-dependent)